MKIVIIGTGNVATVLAKKMIAAQHIIVQLIGRTESSASQLASLLQCPYSLDLKNLAQDADIYFICAQDREIQTIVEGMNIPKEAIVVHTAGGISIEVLAKKFKNYGVFYPLQSLRKETAWLPIVPFFVDANSKENIGFLMDFAKTMSQLVQHADDIQRMHLHIAAVFVSNFTNYLYSLANDFCTTSQIDFSFLLPLIEETAKRLQLFAPAEMQTGPAVRGDRLTIEKHISLLNSFEEAQEVYDFLSKRIETHFKS
ncbi:MAG TPA: DUF2520 domain-containing protein [Arachidicoccus soli]|uniref:DUF2520 domain-containing protein n=1 Tax=Arachidicoccus soli TaxID=2341117 RepID=A0A386HMS8_9BACT|nr:DUF2520 domain-containing protein [Arachidicoccus soli]AYD46982.1 DUF2520 domain-containing protein [Arachidicoccus soli]HEU0228901.1 DUF2520 domain-containing protein [Arachidicoccus soli]